MGREAYLQRLAQGRSYDRPPDWTSWPLTERFAPVSSPVVYECVEDDSTFYGSHFDTKGRPWNQGARNLEDRLADAQDRITSVSLNQDLPDNSSSTATRTSIPATQPSNQCSLKASVDICFKTACESIDSYLWYNVLSRCFLDPFIRELSIGHIIISTLKQPHSLIDIFGAGCITHLQRRARAKLQLLANRGKPDKPSKEHLPLRRQIKGFLSRFETKKILYPLILPAIILNWWQLTQAIIPPFRALTILFSPSAFARFRSDLISLSISLASASIYDTGSMLWTANFNSIITGFIICMIHPQDTDHLAPPRYQESQHSEVLAQQPPGYGTFKFLRGLRQRFHMVLPSLVSSPSAVIEQDPEVYNYLHAKLFVNHKCSDTFNNLARSISNSLAKLLFTPLQAIVLRQTCSIVGLKVETTDGGQFLRFFNQAGLCAAISLMMDMMPFLVSTLIRSL